MLRLADAQESFKPGTFSVDVRREVVLAVSEEGPLPVVGPSGNDRASPMTVVGLSAKSSMAGTLASKAAGEVTQLPIRIDRENRTAIPIIVRDPAIARRREGLAHIRDGIPPGGLRQAETVE